MRAAILVIGLVLSFVPALAQAQQAWVQIEAQPTLREGEERARAYSGVFPNVSGFVMTTGWYAIALGPFAPEEAERQLRLLRGERLIPRDSYIALGESFQSQFWPVGVRLGAVPPQGETPPETDAAALPAPEATAIVPNILPDETPAEARRSEALLTREERQQLQEALKWDDFYAGAIDGAFGRGTRASMAAWQASRGYEETGILTTAQRAELIEGYEAERAALGLETVTEEEARIEIPLPLALVEFDRYQPPFVHYREKGGSGFQMILISQKGDEATLSGLYDVMQTLEIVPLEGERGLNRSSFVLTGKNGKIQSHTEVTLKGGVIKGFTLAWRPEDGKRATKVLEAMRAGFRALEGGALDDSLGQPLAEDRAGLLSGLEVRRPALSRSGFWLDGAGLVATTDEVLAGCSRITLGGGPEADLALHDASSGLAVLKPRAALAPRSHARLAERTPRVGSEISVAGFPYEDALDSAVLSFGSFADTRGLGGENELSRLSVATLPGDAGGPVLDTTGAVIGMLLPRRVENGRVLPDDVGLALDAAAIRRALADGGLAEAEPAGLGDAPAPMAAEDLLWLGRDLTVLVSCWD
ncbi:hypothetical protein DEA8626_00625 [Defluviimonas aquaemixtae]|uniref:Peptidoglycan binding-like domain-containing protein n=1 Tax=Albidovulum aquaemixtae TaxID=1542388 RepID=A0A2R8B3K7_9RHOB|nr:serine protease [Defluviimonas aquaemixtae]SPH17110.1 hypothetical protein DEA8626_00625 [Defluviimonas aquaemixtae]